MEIVAEDLSLPIIITGLSGGGKSTIASEVERRGQIKAVTYTGRLTTRALRPGEIEGKDGQFGVDAKLFDENPDLFFRYAKYGEQYGFSRTALRQCLQQGHTFIVGGEPNTALPIQQTLNSDTEREQLGDISLKAISIYIKRPINEIMKSIISRDAADREKLKRLEHLLNIESHEAHDVAYPVDYEVLNGSKRLEEATREVTDIIISERTKQLRALFGSSFSLPHPANA